MTGRGEGCILSSLMITSLEKSNLSYPLNIISKGIHELQTLQENIFVEPSYNRAGKFLPYGNRSLRNIHQRCNSSKIVSFYYYLLITQNYKRRYIESMKKMQSIWKELSQEVNYNHKKHSC